MKVRYQEQERLADVWEHQPYVSEDGEFHNGQDVLVLYETKTEPRDLVAKEDCEIIENGDVSCTQDVDFQCGRKTSIIVFWREKNGTPEVEDYNYLPSWNVYGWGWFSGHTVEECINNARQWTWQEGLGFDAACAFDGSFEVTDRRTGKVLYTPQSLNA